jgi:hypothetical protein
MLDTLKQDPWPRSHYELIEHYHAQYDKQIASGVYKPFLYPWGTLGAALVIAYLLIPHQNRPWLKNCRYLAFAWIVGFAAYTMIYTRAKGMAPSFGVGLISAWSVCWVSALLICNDAQTDFQRIERLEGAFKSSKPAAMKEKDDQDLKTTDENHDNLTHSPPSSSVSTGSSTSSATSAEQAGTGGHPPSHHLPKPFKKNFIATRATLYPRRRTAHIPAKLACTRVEKNYSAQTSRPLSQATFSSIF